jgi:putative endonuclease
MASDWFLYVLRCADDTLYTGITTDPERRVHEHNNTKQGARYTRCRRPVEMVAVWEYADRSKASKAEYAFKQLRRGEKLERVRRDRALEIAVE